MERKPNEPQDDPDTLLGDADDVDQPSIEEQLDERLRDEQDDDDE
jgi:hypothetical protein